MKKVIITVVIFIICILNTTACNQPTDSNEKTQDTPAIVPSTETPPEVDETTTETEEVSVYSYIRLVL